jgi:hypothetical protein
MLSEYLHSKELVLFAKYNKTGEVKEDEMDRACSTHGEERNVHRLFVGNPEGKRPLGGP